MAKLIFSIFALWNIFLLGESVIANELKIINLGKEFNLFYEENKNENKERQLNVFMESIYSKFPEFYSYKFKQWENKGVMAIDKLHQEMAQFGNYQEKFNDASIELEKYLNEELPVFIKYFPDFELNRPIYIIHSFDEMDGGTRILDGKFFFIFGVESIVKYHKGLDFNLKVPFIHHELFHVYHHQYFKEEESKLSELEMGIWTEGLAVLAAKALNPNATLAQLSLDNPEGLLQQCEELNNKIIHDLNFRINSPSPSDYSTYFYGNSNHPWIPKRAGYCIGYWVISNLLKKYSLIELSRFQDVEIHQNIMDALSIGVTK